MKKILLFFCLIPFLTRLDAQIDSVLSIQLQNRLNTSVSNANNVGVSAHLILPNGQTWSGTAGVGKQNIAISDTTLFHGASTTKLNIATLMMLLVEEELIDLDKSWHYYVSLNVEFDSLITVRQLLNHTSGIADYLETPSSGSLLTADFNAFYTPEYILENIVSATPVFPVGTGFQYSNSNYVLAALIIEHVTENSIQEELRTRIWNPIGMKHTYFGAYESYSEPTAGVWWNFGNGVTDYSNESTTAMLSYAYGAGNIVSCPADLSLLMHHLFKGELLSAESLHEMLNFTPSSYNSWTAGYGLGIHHASGQTDDTVIGHDGYYTNLTDMFYSEKYGFTLVTMTNTQTEWFGIFNPMYDIVKNYLVQTAVNEIDKTIDLTLYPNPTAKGFNIKSSYAIDAIEIKDSMGKVVYQSQDQKGAISLAMETAGIYFVTIKSNQQIITKKLVVRN